MNFKSLTSDAALLEELGRRLARMRVERGLTQAALADAAGIGKRTLERLEAGESVRLDNFVSVLRALDLVEGLESLLPEPGPRPMELLRGGGRERQRASSRRRDDTASRRPWSWGDES